MLRYNVDFFVAIPLVSLADHYGYSFVLCLNLVPRVFLLAWAFAVGYFDRVLPVNAILAAPAFSFLGGDCVFNSIVYSLVSELTDDHVLRSVPAVSRERMYHDKLTCAGQHSSAT